MNRTEIVIFRNPIEAFYWDNPQYIIWIVGIVVALVLVLGILNWFLNRKR